MSTTYLSRCMCFVGCHMMIAIAILDASKVGIQIYHAANIIAASFLMFVLTQVDDE